ncbi:MAG TPA: thiamine-phosphate kinase [Planctomycetaceae bacterium]|nr:thiamine-phosphate kinase [Planctomycetaceae bacterium]
MTTERQFIRQLQARFPARPPVTIGIGDDGAVLDVSSNSQQVVVTDLLLDGVHFDLRSTSPLLAGRKAMAVNLSDLAAMGCRPTAAFVSLAIPRDLGGTGPEFLTELYRGIQQMTDEYQFSLAGGDTNSWNGPFAINVCLTGTPFGVRPFLRSDARAGDVLWVSGRLGGSLRSGRHLTFQPRLRLSEWLSGTVEVHGMMDISDGLSVDLHRLMEASGTAAEIIEAAIPIHPDVPAEWNAEQRLASALSDGEDFELLFTVAATTAESMMVAAHHDGFLMHQIGVVTHGAGVRLMDAAGNSSVLAPKGWQHEF